MSFLIAKTYQDSTPSKNQHEILALPENITQKSSLVTVNKEMLTFKWSETILQERVEFLQSKSL